MKKEALLFLEAVTRYNPVAIYIPGSPDPDAIASAYALKSILDKLSVGADIFAERRLSLPQNQAFLEKLKIPVRFRKEISTDKYKAYIVPDFQDNKIEGISDRIPCVLHIDHHAKSESSVDADLSLIRIDAGSTSTIVALLLKNLDLVFSEKELASIATALAYGIQTDTDKYNYTSELDLEALEYLAPHVDDAIIQEINSIPPSAETLEYYTAAKENEIIYKDWAFYAVGFVNSKSRDSIAITADMLIKRSDYKVIAAFGIVENRNREELYLDVSMRADSSEIDLNRIIKKITPNGGGRQFKGAYQVKLDYFISAPDRELLWKVVKDTTVETLKSSRDSLYITGIQGFYGNLKKRIFSFLQK